MASIGKIVLPSSFTHYELFQCPHCKDVAVQEQRPARRKIPWCHKCD